MPVLMPEKGPYRCGSAARWLPRALAGSLLVSALLVAYRFDPYTEFQFVRVFRIALILFGAWAALWILKSGAEVRLEVLFDTRRIWFGRPPGAPHLEFSEIERLDYHPPFSGSRARWLPAAILLGRDGKLRRVPALVKNGDLLVKELLERSGRSDLASWAESLHLMRRMERSALNIAVGYLLAALILAAALYSYLQVRF